eukprot:Skav220600  [mRNA]  locus=scaffold3435:71631:72830:- [translate_table: standard]
MKMRRDRTCSKGVKRCLGNKALRLPREASKAKSSPAKILRALTAHSESHGPCWSRPDCSCKNSTKVLSCFAE